MNKLTSSLLIHPEELDAFWIDRCAALGIPTLSLHPVGGAAADQSMEALLAAAETPAFRALLDRAEEKGLTVEYEMHAARYLLPASAFAAHPDWFRENENGERTPDFNCCVSSAEALDFMADRARIAARKLHPRSHRYFFWMDDGRSGACRCEKCRQYSASEQQLIVMNRLLKEIRRDDPAATLAYLAYCDCMQVPEKVAPADGIFLEYAPFDRDFHKPLADAEDEKNRQQTATLSALLDTFGRDTAKVLDYWLDNSLYSGWKKPPKAFSPDAPVIFSDFAYYRRLGFRDFSTFACYLGADYRELYGEPDIMPFANAFHWQETEADL